MEKKKTQRIMGALVIVSVFIIALPLFFNTTDATSEAANAKMPVPLEQSKNSPQVPQPVVQPDSPPVDAPVQPALASTPTQSIAPSPETQSAILASVPTQSMSPVPVPTQPTSPAPVSAPLVSSEQQNDNTPTPVSNSVDLTSDVIDSANNENATTTTPSPPINTTASNQNMNSLMSHEEGVVPLGKANTHLKAKKISSKKLAKSHAATLRLHKLAWVVQMGSFKNKENARRLTDRLRTAGFKAFTIHVQSGSQERVRVYVGPESQQASASKLSNRVARQINMQGIVIPYKPLAL